MRLSELIETLLDMQENMPNRDPEVMSSSDYGDYHHTEQLDNICEVTLVIPTQEAYSRTGLGFPQEIEEEEEEEPGLALAQREADILTSEKSVVVLRYKSE